VALAQATSVLTTVLPDPKTEVEEEEKQEEKEVNGKDIKDPKDIKKEKA
jgi:hypothetical protein